MLAYLLVCVCVQANVGAFEIACVCVNNRGAVLFTLTERARMDLTCAMSFACCTVEVLLLEWAEMCDAGCQ